ncbi:MAG: HlyD family type I secretion periplasmic adaptor subunit [Oceanicaulis sp.]
MTAAAASAPDESGDVLSAIARPALIAGAVVAAFVAAFVGWGATAPISGGAIASGRISPEGSRRTVQHLEGGIIESFEVSDGDAVAPGDVLIVLRETQARASFQVLLNQQLLYEAQRARLRGEQAGRDAIDFSSRLLEAARTDPQIAELLDTQRELFTRRTELHANRQRVFRQRIAQLDAEIDGLREQIVSQNERLRLIGEEINDTRSLYERGLAPRPRLLALQREEASISEQRAANRAAIARAQQSIGEAEVSLLAADAQRLDQVSTELNEVQAQLSEVNERLLASEDVLDRTVIRAPIAGTVVNLRLKTEGGVIRPGEPILDIVPEEEALIISARLSPIDVDLVTIGQTAAVHLSALPQQSLPRIEGEVIGLSADALTDEQSGESYFNVRVRVDIAEIDRLSAQLGEDLTLTPGMPAEVLIVTGERTLVDYLIEPLRNSMRNALREG